MTSSPLAATKTTEGIKQLQEQAVEEGLRQTRSYVAINPLITVGIAFAAWVLLSTLIRR